LSRPTTFRVFISAVSNELGSLRSEVARVLRRKGVEVREQEHFSQGGATLLERLREYIQQCDAVILLVGERYGAFPTDEHVRALDSVTAFEEYRRAKKQPQASYTQWELFLARQYGRKTYVFVTEGAFIPDKPNGEPSELRLRQHAYREWVEQLGLHSAPLTTAQKLIEDVLVLDFPDLGRPTPVSLPYPSLRTLFKGREDALERLRASLEMTGDGQATAIVGRAVHGLGGVGKTRLAVEYAWRQASDYSALLFVSGSTPQDLNHSLAALCGPLVLDLPEQNVKEEEARVAAVLRWLADHPRWLLILDGIDSKEGAEGAERILPRLQGGHVVLTSRLTDWSGCVERLELDVLHHEDATKFLLERTNRGRRKLPTDAIDAAELAHELDGLALALEQAGAYIGHRRFTLSEYHAKWREQLSGVREWHDERLMKYPCSVAVTWQITMEQFAAGDVALLRLLAWLAPEPLPLFVFEKDGADLIWQEAVSLGKKSSAASGSFFDALATLARYSMANWNTEDESVSVHRVVQEILRTRVPEIKQREWLILAIRLLDQSKPGNPDDVRTWPRWERLQPHMSWAVERAQTMGDPDPTTALLNHLGQLLREKALYTEAEPLLRRALAIDEASYGPEHPDVARDLNNLALVLQATSRLGEAEPLMRRALAIAEATFGSEHPIVAIGLNNLAELLHATNRFEDAERLMRRALAISEATWGREHPKVAIRLNNLSMLLQATNRVGEAEPLMWRALAIDEATYGPEHPKVAIRLNNLAQLLQGTGRLEEAGSHLSRALAIVEASYPPEHPQVANALNNFATLLQRSNRLEEAVPLLQRALAIDTTVYGPEHPQVANRLHNLAVLLRETKLEEAESLMRRALEILVNSSRSTGHPHPYFQSARSAYEGFLRAMGHTEADVRAKLETLLSGR
jgi:tetratricopeptide (TPR) repeat protein